MDTLKKKYKKHFTDFTWKEIEQKFKNVPVETLEKYIKKYRYIGASAPGMIRVSLLRSKFGKMTIEKLRGYAKQKGVYTIWVDGTQKNKNDLIDSLILYTLEPKKYLKTQKEKRPTEPKVAKRITVKEMTSKQKALNKLKVNELKDLCRKYNLKCIGRKIDIINRLIDNIPLKKLIATEKSPVKKTRVTIKKPSVKKTRVIVKKPSVKKTRVIVKKTIGTVADLRKRCRKLKIKECIGSHYMKKDDLIKILKKYS